MAKAFIRKPENGKPGDVSPAVRLASALAAGCMLCPLVGEPATAADAPPTAPALVSIVHAADPVIRWPARDPAEPGDREPPHNELPEQTRDGSAPTYAVTAPTLWSLLATTPRWPAGTLGLPGHAVLPWYSAGPHAAPTHLLPGVPPAAEPGAASTGPSLAAR